MGSCGQAVVSEQGAQGSGHVQGGNKHSSRALRHACTGARAQVAIKFEASTSKGLGRNGTPHEWAVYAKLGALYGVPRIFARGRLGDYFTMVRLMPLAPPSSGRGS